MPSLRHSIIAVGLAALALAAQGCGTNSTLAPTSQSLDSTAPAAPSLVHSVKVPGGVALTWQANSEADIAGYEIYRFAPSPERDNAYVKVTSTLVTGTEWLAGDPVTCDGYYRVKAIDTSANASPASTPTLVTGISGDSDSDPGNVRH